MKRFFMNVLTKLISTLVRLAKFGSFFLSLYLLYRLTATMAPQVVPTWVSAVEKLFKIQLPPIDGTQFAGNITRELPLFLMGVGLFAMTTWLTYRLDKSLHRRRLEGFLVRTITPHTLNDRNRKDEYILAYARPHERTGEITSYIIQVVAVFCGLLIWHYYVPGPEAIDFFKALAERLNPVVSTAEFFGGSKVMFSRFGIGLAGMVIALWAVYQISRREARAHSFHYYMTDRALVVVQSYLGGWLKSKNKLLFWTIKPWHPRKILYGHLRLPEPQTSFSEEFFWNRRTMTIPFDTDVHLEGPEAVLYHVKPEFFWLTDDDKRKGFIDANPDLKTA
jgi:hypothetical protein